MKKFARVVGLLAVFVGAYDALAADPPLLRTSLPNGYSFHSNGGEFGYIADRNGAWMSEYFGILNNDEEKWCRGFAWADDLVVCERVEYSETGLEPSSSEYFFLDTATGEIAIERTAGNAERLWRERIGTDLPVLRRSYPGTREE